MTIDDFERYSRRYAAEHPTTDRKKPIVIAETEVNEDDIEEDDEDNADIADLGENTEAKEYSEVKSEL